MRTPKERRRSLETQGSLRVRRLFPGPIRGAIFRVGLPLLWLKVWVVEVGRVVMGTAYVSTVLWKRGGLGMKGLLAKYGSLTQWEMGCGRGEVGLILPDGGSEGPHPVYRRMRSGVVRQRNRA